MELIKLIKMDSKEFYDTRRTQTIHLLISHKNNRILFIHMQDIDLLKTNKGKGVGKCEWIFLEQEGIRYYQDTDKDTTYYNNTLGKKYLKHLADLNNG